MSNRRNALSLIGATLLSAGAAQAQNTPPAEATDQRTLYAVELMTGAAWDPAKPAQEQAYFRDHSANLKRLRDQGHLVIGARYADKGLIVLAAASESEAHALMQQDLSVQHKTFRYELHEFSVFYGGAVHPKRRASRS